ncbi:thymidylate synthase [uncultured Shewanella sp.]|uniref:thymidylate synthase n=1 Tax=uncultured Shewanella sp. TaxID=173975 RepID=UPI0026318625|nr:thymidylate synthase [uncultured Shewanella sp.]
MINIIKGQSINELTYRALKKVTSDGHSMSSRNGNTVTLYNTELILENPRARHLRLEGRTNNIFAVIAETFWVLAGRKDIKPYLEFFIPRAPKYSDDGITWRAAYGERLYAFGQLENILECFKKDGIFTRRAVLSLYFPSEDTHTSLRDKYNLEKTLDIPCNNLLNFYVTPNKKLNLKVTQRSGDIIFGVCNVNIFEFTVIQELVLQYLKKEVDDELTMGYYNHSVTNLHLYDFTEKQGYNVIENLALQQFHLDASGTMAFPSEIKLNKEFFENLVDLITGFITNDKFLFESGVKEARAVFDYYGVKTVGNLLWDYTTSVLCFVYEKKAGQYQEIDLHHTSEEFRYSVLNSGFKKQPQVEL